MRDKRHVNLCMRMKDHVSARATNVRSVIVKPVLWSLVGRQAFPNPPAGTATAKQLSAAFGRGRAGAEKKSPFS